MIEKIKAFYKDNDESVYAYVYYNDETGFYETHLYDNHVDKAPVILSKLFIDALEAGERWVQ